MISAISGCWDSILSCCQGTPDVVSQTAPRVDRIAQYQLVESPSVVNPDATDLRPVGRIEESARSDNKADSIVRHRLNLPKRNSLEEALIQGAKDRKKQPLISEQKLVTLPSGLEVLYREIGEKEDSFFLSYVVCLWDHILESGSAQFLIDATYSAPMFSDADREQVFEMLRTGLDVQNPQHMQTWVNLLRTLAGSALEDSPNRESTYRKVRESFIQRGDDLNLSEDFSDESFENLVRMVRYGDAFATLPIIEALMGKLQKKVSIFLNDPTSGLKPCALKGAFPEIGKILYKDKCFYPMEYPILVECLQDGDIRMKTKNPSMTFFTGYATAMLHICYQNKAFEKKLRQNPNSDLSLRSVEILKNAASVKSAEGFQAMLKSVLPIEILAKDLKSLWESANEDSSLEEITPESLQILMEKTGIPIQLKQEDTEIFFGPISYGTLTLEGIDSALYTPARTSSISSLYNAKRIPHIGLITFANLIRSKEIEAYQRIKDRPNIVFMPDLLSKYQLLCKRGEVFEGNKSVLARRDVKSLLRKEEEKISQILQNPSSQKSQRQIFGLGDFLYFSELDIGDKCELVSHYRKNEKVQKARGAKDLVSYYHKTDSLSVLGYPAVVHSTQGDYPYMEDRSIVTTFSIPLLDANPILLTGVFDGHAGEKCAEHLKSYLSDTLQKHLMIFADKTNYPDFTLDAIVCNALRQALVELDYAYLESAGGSTATVSVKVGNFLYTANVGDSRTVLVSQDRWKQLSIDAEPNEEPHKTIVETLGGSVTKAHNEPSCRISYDVGMGSSIGDHSVLGTNPTVTFSKTDLTDYPNAVLVAVSDGATDVATSREIARVIQNTYFSEKGLSLQNTADSMGYSCYKNGAYDNTTLVMVALNSTS